MENVVIASDHAAIDRKRELKEYLEGRGYAVTDLGAHEGDRADYPDKAVEACRAYLGGGYAFGVLCCGTGIGISIAANKVDGIRCALPQNAYAARMAREHNDCNFIAFGGRVDYPEPVASILGAFIDAAFEGGRHADRVEKIMRIGRS